MRVSKSVEGIAGADGFGMVEKPPSEEIKKDQDVSPRLVPGEDTLVLSNWEDIMAGSRMSREKDVLGRVPSDCPNGLPE